MTDLQVVLAVATTRGAAFELRGLRVRALGLGPTPDRVDTFLAVRGSDIPVLRQTSIQYGTSRPLSVDSVRRLNARIR
jgi:hypothetical protein